MSRRTERLIVWLIAPMAGGALGGNIAGIVGAGIGGIAGASIARQVLWGSYEEPKEETR